MREIDENYHMCAWNDHGMRCPNYGTVSPSTSEPQGTVSGEGSKANWYCGWHYECLTHGHPDNKNSVEYQNFLRFEAYYSRGKSAQRNGWNANDEYQVKGLAVLGEGSIAWRKAPPELQQRARELIANGWTPKTQTVARVITEAVTAPENFESEKRRLIVEFNQQIRDNKRAAGNDVDPDGCPF